MSATDRFALIAKVGQGGYGKVYQVREKATGETYALKRMHVAADGDESEGIPAAVIREIGLQKQLRHPNICRLYDALLAESHGQHHAKRGSLKVTLVFDYCQHDLRRYMESKDGELSPDDIRHFFSQLLLGLHHMHEKHVVHRDLKPENLLIAQNRVLKIGDFGLARVEGLPTMKYAHDAGSLWYRPPDAILGSVNYGFPLDMWSAGCILAEMALGKPLFDGRTDQEQLFKMFSLLGSPTPASWPTLATYPRTASLFEHFPQLQCDYTDSAFQRLVSSKLRPKLGADGVSLLRQLLSFNPTQRPSANTALEHPFFMRSPILTSSSEQLEQSHLQLPSA
jgi:cyclin-dependent kinase